MPISKHLLTGAAMALTVLGATTIPPALAGSQSNGPSDVLIVAFDTTVMEIQRLLNRAGYDAGPADGLMGNRTRGAIVAYERDNKLLITGEPSASLLQYLQRKEGAGGAAAAEDGPGEQRFRSLQKNLASLGYDVRTTGALDSQTRDAIRAFQRDEELLVNGIYSTALAERVQEEVQAEAEREEDKKTTDGVDQKQLADIQGLLKDRGYVVGNTKGTLDDRTRKAIRAYQNEYDLPITGEPTSALQKHLLGSVIKNPPPAMVRQVQKALKQRNYYAGAIDGQMSESTRASIIAYRRDNNMVGVGGISPKMVRLLATGGGKADASKKPSSKRDFPVAAISDGFKDGNYTENPRWQVLQGRFWVKDAELRSSVNVSDSGGAGGALLRSVLDNALGIEIGDRASVIALSIPVKGAFRMGVRVKASPGARSVLNIGMYRSANAAYGYRLRYDRTRNGQFKLFTAVRNSARGLADWTGNVKLDDNAWHTVWLERRSGGLITVAVDGQKIMETTDQSFEDFDGFSLINGGGDWALGSVTIRVPKP